MNKEIIKIAGIEFTKEEIKKLKEEYYDKNKKYIIKYKTIYELVYNEPRFDKLNEGYFGARLVYRKDKSSRIGFVKRGRFVIWDAEGVNRLIGKNIFVEN